MVYYLAMKICSIIHYTHIHWNLIIALILGPQEISDITDFRFFHEVPGIIGSGGQASTILFITKYPWTLSIQIDLFSIEYTCV